jgi:hypothetical protein
MKIVRIVCGALILGAKQYICKPCLEEKSGRTSSERLEVVQRIT